MWLGSESNQRHMDFLSTALPTELPSHLVIKLVEKSGLNIEKGGNIHQVHTFIFLKGGEEIGRIV